MTVPELEDILYKKSGLLGVSEISSDVRALIASNDSKANEALDLYVYMLVREIGSLVSALGGLDGIVFTGGVGENSAEIRQRALQKLSWLGFEIDEKANNTKQQKISSRNSQLSAYVLHTNENLMIARQVVSQI